MAGPLSFIRVLDLSRIAAACAERRCLSASGRGGCGQLQMTVLRRRVQVRPSQSSQDVVCPMVVQDCAMAGAVDIAMEDEECKNA